MACPLIDHKPILRFVGSLRS